MFDSLPPLPLQRRSSVATEEELSGLVSYLRQVIVDYGAGAADLGLELDEGGVERVLAALEAQTAGQPWEMPVGDDVEAFFLHGLYFELSERRHSIQEKVGTKTIPLSDAIWLQVLNQIRRGIRG